MLNPINTLEDPISVDHSWDLTDPMSIDHSSLFIDITTSYKTKCLKDFVELYKQYIYKNKNLTHTSLCFQYANIFLIKHYKLAIGVM